MSQSLSSQVCKKQLCKHTAVAHMSQCQVHSSRAMRQRGQPGRHTMVDGAGAETIPQAHSPSSLNGRAECKSTTLDEKMQNFPRKAAQVGAHFVAPCISCPSRSLFCGRKIELWHVRALENLNAAISTARRHLSVLKGGRPRSLHHSHSDHDDSTHLAVRSWCPGRTLRGPGTNSPPQPTFHPVQKRASQSHRRVCVDITRIVGSGTFSAGGLGARGSLGQWALIRARVPHNVLT